MEPKTKLMLFSVSEEDDGMKPVGTAIVGSTVSHNNNDTSVSHMNQ